jgi:hypothetical protein
MAVDGFDESSDSTATTRRSDMNIDRRTLYLGVFLIAAGGVLLAGQTGALDSASAAQAIGLWPLAFVAIGLALVLRGTRLGLAGGLVAAALPGLLLGGLVVAAPDLSIDCGTDRPATYRDYDGSFDGPAVVDLDLACGRLDLDTADGHDWLAHIGDDGWFEPIIESGSDRLFIRTTRRQPFDGGPWVGESWFLTLPRDIQLDLVATIAAGRADLDLTGATLRRIVLDLAAASGRLVLPDGRDLVLDLEVDAGELSVCVPDGLGLRVHQTSELSSVTLDGVERSAGTWETPGYSTATHRADVIISVNVGDIDIVTTEGACK